MKICVQLSVKPYNGQKNRNKLLKHTFCVINFRSKHFQKVKTHVLTMIILKTEVAKKTDMRLFFGDQTDTSSNEVN